MTARFDFCYFFLMVKICAIRLTAVVSAILALLIPATRVNAADGAPATNYGNVPAGTAINLTNQIASQFHPEFTLDTARLAAENGDAQAQYFLGRLYAKGDGVPKDYAKAAEYFRQSAAQGYAWAQNNLGAFYAQGLGVPQDYSEAVKWFRKAADQGDPLAQCSLGLSYSLGRGVPTNITEALKWYQLAAAQNQPDALLALGGLYLGGRGIPADHIEARKWLEKAAAQNCADAYNDLGLIYEQGGAGLNKNMGQALKYYRLAAEKGVGKGQMNLGRMYLYGFGVPKDFIEAYKWFYLAYRNGGGIARHYMDELNGTVAYGDVTGNPLTFEQIQEAVRRAKEFQNSLLRNH
jgi:TPR repeat protein